MCYLNVVRIFILNLERGMYCKGFLNFLNSVVLIEKDDFELILNLGLENVI